MKKKVAIIGSGPSALMLAATLLEAKFDITIYEQKQALARKFLVAGDGGFNLTHSENPEQMLTRYLPSGFMDFYINTFTNHDLRNWLSDLNIETFVGTSRRVFPLNTIKPIQVLKAIIDFLKNKNVVFCTEHTWKGWNNELLVFETKKGQIEVKADYYIFALGGNSWSVTGSDGYWQHLFSRKSIVVQPFEASNCAFKVDWPQHLLSNIEGSALKNISVSVDGLSIAGEVVLTQFGIEGNAVYAHSHAIRKQLKANGKALIYIDLKCNLSEENLLKKLHKPIRSNWTNHVTAQLNLSKLQIILLKHFLTKDDFLSPSRLSAFIKAFPVTLVGTAPIDEAISTVGGVDLSEVDQYLQLKKLPSNYVIGEMLNWDAPTGGYLLQACFSMGYTVAKHLNDTETTLSHQF
jgi:uncharacterized flavoprotein (TIGR03862 family)